MNEDEILKKWREFQWADNLYSDWRSFFSNLAGQPARAGALCRLGMRLLDGELTGEPAIRAAFDKVIHETRPA